jgi:hypothetical protein
LSFAVLYSSAVLGVSARMILHRPAPALSFAILFRVIPVALTMLSPNAFIEPSYLDGVLRSTWNQNFIITLADTGVSALFGFAEPSWHTWHLGGTNISSALLASVLVFYMLLGYIVISLLLVYFLKNRTTNERSISAYRHRDQSASAQL